MSGWLALIRLAHWNFEKFLIDRQGAVAGRFRSRTTPMDPALVGAIERALGGTLPAGPVAPRPVP